MNRPLLLLLLYKFCVILIRPCRLELRQRSSVCVCVLMEKNSEKKAVRHRKCALSIFDGDVSIEASEERGEEALHFRFLIF